ncbi:MAG: hypothetical protein Q8R95_12355 [Azonexus sp.]|nr:hypothetical protein [Azonexus sp.]
MTFSYIVVVIPFLLVSVYIFVTLETLDRHNHVVITEVSETSRLSSEITEDLIHLERSLRCYEILKNVNLQSNVRGFFRPVCNS